VTGRISWVYTEDLESTAPFYAQLLGFECVRDEGGARIYATGIDAFIGVCQVFTGREVEPQGGMISIVTDNVDAWYQTLVARGLTIKPPHRLEQFAIVSFFVEDPNGYLIEFQQFD